MRAICVVVILLTTPILIPCIMGVEDPGVNDEKPQGRSVPEISNVSLDITFDKNEYIFWNFSGNTTINVTFHSKSGSYENISLTGRFDSFSIDRLANEPSYPEKSSDLANGLFISLAPYENKVLQINLTYTLNSNYKNGYYDRVIYIITAENSHIQSINYTTITNLGPYSLEIISPVTSMREYRTLIDIPIDIKLRLTNYSDKTLDGTIHYSRNTIPITIKPRDNTIISLTIKPYKSAIQDEIRFSLYSDYTSTSIGYIKTDGIVTNVTDSYIVVAAQKFIGIEIPDSSLKLSETGIVNITIFSGANHIMKNLRFTVEITGWLSERISHRGEFTVATLESWKWANISYAITSHVAGRFSIKVSIISENNQFSAVNNNLIVESLIGPSVIITSDERDVYSLGDMITLAGTVTNRYAYPLRDVKLIVMVEQNFHGFLSREDFMGFDPLEITIDRLESGRTFDFIFNVTFDSTGAWKMAVVALWAGNVSYGGDGALFGFRIHRIQFEYSPIGIVIALSFVSIIPKTADLMLRRMRGIRS